MDRLLQQDVLHHLVEVLQNDIETTTDVNSISTGDCANATPETIAYIARSRAILEMIQARYLKKEDTIKITQITAQSDPDVWATLQPKD